MSENRDPARALPDSTTEAGEGVATDGPRTEESASSWQSRTLAATAAPQPSHPAVPRRRWLGWLCAGALVAALAFATLWLVERRQIGALRQERAAALRSAADARSEAERRAGRREQQRIEAVRALERQLELWRAPLDQAPEVHLEASSPLAGRGASAETVTLRGDALRTTFVLHPSAELAAPPYVLRLVTGADRRLWSLPDVSTNDFGEVVLSIPTDELVPGRYRLELLVAADGEKQSVVATFPFLLARPSPEAPEL